MIERDIERDIERNRERESIVSENWIRVLKMKPKWETSHEANFVFAYFLFKKKIEYWKIYSLMINTWRAQLKGSPIRYQLKQKNSALSNFSFLFFLF